MFILEHPELCLDDAGLFVLQDSASEGGCASQRIFGSPCHWTCDG